MSSLRQEATIIERFRIVEHADQESVTACSASGLPKAAGDPVSLSPFRRRAGRTPIPISVAYHGWGDAGMGKARRLGPCEGARDDTMDRDRPWRPIAGPPYFVRISTRCLAASHLISHPSASASLRKGRRTRPFRTRAPLSGSVMRTG